MATSFWLSVAAAALGAVPLLRSCVRGARGCDRGDRLWCLVAIILFLVAIVAPHLGGPR